MMPIGLYPRVQKVEKGVKKSEGFASGGNLLSRNYVYEESHSSDYLFKQNALRRYDLFLEDTDLAFLDADPVREQYVEVALLFEGKLVPAVGIRYKGEAGSFIGFVENFQEGDTSAGPKTASKLAKCQRTS
ncbi:MAG: hypothetical protein GY854_17490 [Deltaproteobacteria bacterium]|nr:hypothetical protein [Deltaproteobacteria bacterium]